jgi:hypothetical protein
MIQRYLRWSLFVGLSIGILGTSWTQADVATTSCYERLLRTGNRFFQRQQFARAANQYRTALESCEDVPEDNPLDSLLRAVQREEVAWLAARNQRLVALVAETQRLAQREAEARQEAEAARRLAEQNAELARENEWRAIRSGRQAATLRYSALAELEREEGNRKNALLLSLLALRYSDETSYAPAMQAFTRIVADSFARSTDYWAGIREVRVGAGHVDVVTNEGVERLDLSGRQHSPQPLPGAEVLAATGTDVLLHEAGTYRWWSARDGKSRTLPEARSVRAVHVLRPGAELITVGTDSSVLHWQFDAAPVVMTRHAAGRNYAIVPLGRPDGAFAVRTSAGVVELWRPGQRQPERTLHGNGAYVYDCLAKQDRVVLGTAAGEVLVYSATAASPRVLRHGNRAVVRLYDLAGDPELLLSRGDDHELKIWNLTGDLRATLPVGAAIAGLQDWPEARRIIVWTTDRRVTVWSYAGEQLDEYRSFSSPVLAVGYVPGEAYLYATSQDGTLTLLESGEPVGEWSVLASAGTLPRYLPETERLVLVGPTGDRLLTVPLPQQHYRNLREHFSPASLPPALVDKYDIAFWEE